MQLIRKLYKNDRFYLTGIAARSISYYIYPIKGLIPVSTGNSFCISLKFYLATKRVVIFTLTSIYRMFYIGDVCAESALYFIL